MLEVYGWQPWDMARLYPEELKAAQDREQEKQKKSRQSTAGRGRRR